MLMQVEIGNYDSFYDAGIVFSPDQVCRYHINQILNLTVETRRILPFVTLSVTVPHTLSLPDQVIIYYKDQNPFFYEQYKFQSSCKFNFTGEACGAIATRRC